MWKAVVQLGLLLLGGCSASEVPDDLLAYCPELRNSADDRMIDTRTIVMSYNSGTTETVEYAELYFRRVAIEDGPDRMRVETFNESQQRVTHAVDVAPVEHAPGIITFGWNVLYPTLGVVEFYPGAAVNESPFAGERQLPPAIEAEIAERYWPSDASPEEFLAARVELSRDQADRNGRLSTFLGRCEFHDDFSWVD